MKYYLIAGEKSGDLHAAKLIEALKNQDSKAQFRAFGGDKMQQAGAEIVQHYKDMAFMGFADVLKNFWTIKKLYQKCQQDILAYQPDAIILVDYAGFNLRIAEFAKKKGFKIFYYISPKIWAWNQGRANKIKRLVDKMFVILPFEKDFYQKFNYEVDYVGNPLLDQIQNFKPNPNFFEQNQIRKPVIALLAGSRRSEIKYMLPKMLAVVPYFQDYEFVVAAVDNVPPQDYRAAQDAGVKLVFEQSYEILAIARAALVCSGTASLETALFQVPQVVCYQTQQWQYTLGKMLIQVPFISLVNLIAGKEVVRELIQKDFELHNLVKELKAILGQKRPQILVDYKNIKNQLATQKSPSQQTAHLIWEYLQK